MRGTIRGMCIEEAGYYERGRLKEEIEIPLTDRFDSHEFQIKGRSGKDGEIRVYTVDGREDTVSLDELVKEKDSSGILGGF